MTARLEAGVRSLLLTIDRPVERIVNNQAEYRNDLAAVKVWCSTAPDFTPSDTNLVFDGLSMSISITALADGTPLSNETTYYVRYALISEIDLTYVVPSQVLQATTPFVGIQTKTVKLYRWSTTPLTMPASSPTGISTYTWESGVLSYNDADSWRVQPQANPGGSSILYEYYVTITDEIVAISTTISNWTTGSIRPYSVEDTSVVKGVTLELYAWDVSGVLAPDLIGTNYYRWADDTIVNASNVENLPSGWTRTIVTAPSRGMTLWKAIVDVVDTASQAQTVINWTSAIKQPISYTGLDGTSGLTGNLTNDFHAIPTDSDGNNGVYTNASTSMSVYLGDTEDTGWAFYISGLSNVVYRDADDLSDQSDTGPINGIISSFPVRVVNLLSDTGYLDITASKSGYPNITKRFSVSKNKAGVNGTTVTFVYIENNTNVIYKNAPDAATSGTHSSVTFYATTVTGNTTPVRTNNIYYYTLTTDAGAESARVAVPSTGITISPVDGDGKSKYTIKLYSAATGGTLLDTEVIPVVFKGATGAASITADLSNDYHAIPTDSAGNNAVYTNANTTMTVYSGGVADTGWSFYVSALANITYRDADDASDQSDTGPSTAIISAFPLSIRSITADTGFVDITATKGSTSITKRFSLSKNKGGVDGQTVTYYYISPSANVIYKDSPDQTTDGTHTAITFSAFKVVGTAAPVAATDVYYTITPSTGSEAATATAYTAPVTPTIANSADIANYTFRIYNNSTKTVLLDTETVPVVYKGLPGANGTNAVTAVLSNESHVFPASSAGAVSSYVGSGTLIRVYDGATEIPYDGVGTNNNSWTVSTSATNITVGGITDSGTYATVADHSGVANGTDTSSITYTISGKTNAGVLFTITKTQTFSKSKTGTDGTSPLIYDIVTSTPVITKDAPDAATSGTHTTVTIQGKQYSGSTTTNYGWITVQNAAGTYIVGSATTSTDTATTAYSLSPANNANTTSYTVKLYNGANPSTATLLDTATIPVVFKGATGTNGASAVTATLSNETHVFPATSAGAVSSYVGSGTLIRVYEGATEIPYDGVGTNNNSWTVSTSATNITVGGITDSGTYATVADHSGVANGTDTSSITYTITGKTNAGTIFTVTKTQTFSKSKTGTDGQTAILYYISPSASVIYKDSPDQTTDGTHSSITFSAFKVVGTAAPVAATDVFYTITPSTGTEAATATQYTGPVTPTIASSADIANYTFKIYNNSTKTVLLDSETIPVVFKGTAGTNGASAVTAVISNEAHVFPASSAGAVSSYVGSGTLIRVYEGATEIPYDGIGTNNNSWTVSTSATNITVGGITDSGSYATVADHYGVANGTDTSSITYTITGKTNAGTIFTVTKSQSFSKSKTGTNATIYYIESSSGVIYKNAPDQTTDGVHTNVTFNAYKVIGNAAPVAATDTFYTLTPIPGDEGTAAAYTTAVPTSITNSADITGYIFKIYSDSGKATLLDSQTVPVVFKGQDGTTPATVTVTGPNTFSFNSTSSIPTTTSIVLTASLTGSLTTYLWQYYNGSTWVDLSGTNNASTYTLQYNNSEWGTLKTLRIRCLSGSVSDELSVYKVYDGTDAISVTNTNPTVTLQAANDGTISSTSGSGTEIQVYEGATALTYNSVVTNYTAPTVVSSVGTNFGSSTTGSITMPSGLQNGDTLFVYVVSDAGTSVTTATSGWTRQSNTASGADAYGALFVATYSGTLAALALSGMATATVALAVAVRGAGTLAYQTATGSGADPDPAAITTTNPNSLVVIFGGLDDVTVSSVVAPAGYTSILNGAATFITSTTTRATAMGAYKLVASAGAENPAAFDTSNATVENWTAITISIAAVETQVVNPGAYVITQTYTPNGTNPLTLGMITGSNTTTAIIPDITANASSSSIDNYTITYTITGKRQNGSDFATETTQQITKAKAGATGPTGPTGATGVSYRTAYVVSTTDPATGSNTITQTGNQTTPPSTYNATVPNPSTVQDWFTAGATWFTSAQVLTEGQKLFQSDGLYDPVANTTTWGRPYLSSLRVGSLSAITTNTGSLTVTGNIIGGTTPAITGTTIADLNMTGSGVYFDNTGRFAIGNSSLNLVSNGSGAIKFNGDVLVNGTFQSNNFIDIVNPRDSLNSVSSASAVTNWVLVRSAATITAPTYSASVGAKPAKPALVLVGDVDAVNASYTGFATGTTSALVGTTLTASYPTASQLNIIASQGEVLEFEAEIYLDESLATLPANAIVRLLGDYVDVNGSKKSLYNYTTITSHTGGGADVLISSLAKNRWTMLRAQMVIPNRASLVVSAATDIAASDNQQYEIVSLGTTDFTLLGASANTVGTVFTHTNATAGTGTGTVKRLSDVAAPTSKTWTGMQIVSLTGALFNNANMAIYVSSIRLFRRNRLQNLGDNSVTKVFFGEYIGGEVDNMPTATPPWSY